MNISNSQIKENEQLQVLMKKINSMLKEELKQEKIKNKEVPKKIKDVKELLQEALFQKEIMNRLEETHKRKDELFEDINQDVRTNLVVIKSYSDLLHSQKFGELTKTQQEKIRAVKESADRLSELFLKILEKMKKVKEETPDNEVL